MMNNIKRLPPAWLLFISIIGVALVLPALNNSLIDHPPEYDEFLHILAARGVIETGEPVIEQGIYIRAEYFTRLTAMMIQIGGDELFWVRLPAIVSGMLLIAVVACWISVKAGWIAGMASAAFLAVSPLTIQMSVLVRFYTLHALFITLLLMVMFELSTFKRGIWRYLSLILAAIALFLVAMHLQPLTLISTAAGLAAVSVVILGDNMEFIRRTVFTRKYLFPSILVAVTAVFLLLVKELNVVEQLRGFTPEWGEKHKNFHAYYISTLSAYLPLLWPLFPVAALVTAIEYRRFGIYCVTIVVVALLAHSVAGQKAPRYIYHFYPFICVVLGLGFQKLVYSVSDLLSQLMPQSKRFTVVASLVICGLCLLISQESKNTIKLLLGKGHALLTVQHEPDWSLAAAELKPFVVATDRLIASNGFYALYTFGRYDYELHHTIVTETETGEQFAIDNRTGKQVISSPEATREVINMPGSELFILETRFVNKPYGASVETVQVINSLCSQLEIVEASQLSAWQCK